MTKTTSVKQEKVLLKPCPNCGKKLGIVGDLSDFKHDIVCHTENDSECDYMVDFWGNVYGDKPECGKQYSLTGKSGDKCIMNGNSWKDSEVKK